MKKRRPEDKFVVKLAESRGTEREDYLATLRFNVRSFMEECDYTMDELSEIAGVPLSTFRDFLYGNTATVKMTPIIRLAKEFGISIDELVGADTLNAEVKEAVQTIRRLPEHFHYFFLWSIRTAERERNRIKPKQKCVNLLRPECASGGLIPPLVSDVIDISDLSPALKTKIFMAIKIPCEHYMPVYSPYHVLLIAHDRPPRPTETCVVMDNGLFWLCNKKEEGYCSIRDGKFRGANADELIGYVAATKLIER